MKNSLQLKKKNDYLRANYFASMLTANPFIEKSHSGIRFSGDRYSYVLNNPLKYTDPSGYVYRYKRIEWEQEVTDMYSSGGGGSPANRNTSWYDIYRSIKNQGYDISMTEAMDIYDDAVWDSYDDNGVSSEYGDIMTLTNEVFYSHLTLTSHDKGKSFQISKISTRRESYSVKIIVPSQDLIDLFHALQGSEDISVLANAVAAVGVSAKGLSLLDGRFSFIHGQTGRLRLRYYSSGWKGGSVARIKTYNLSGPASGIAFGASLFTTALAYHKIASGDSDPLMYADATVGTIGMMNSLLHYFKGTEVPYVGEFVLFYSLASLAWDAGTDLREVIHPDPWFNKEPEPRVFDIDWNK